MPDRVRRSGDSTSASVTEVTCPRCEAPDLALDRQGRQPVHDRPGTRARCDGSRLRHDDLV